jgi:hypothetical protein
MEFDPQTAGIAAAFIAPAGIFTVFIFKASWWLKQQFVELKDFVTQWLQLHEDKDQHRHEDNIQRFAKIETKLDIVIKNGH